MLIIRFLRTGKKNQPSFRIIVTEKRTPPKGGKFLEILGSYNPRTKEKKLNTARVKYWLSVGAKLSPSVHNLLVEEKIIKGEKIVSHKLSKKKPATTSATTPTPENKEVPADKLKEKT